MNTAYYKDCKVDLFTIYGGLNLCHVYNSFGTLVYTMMTHQNGTDATDLARYEAQMFRRL